MSLSLSTIQDEIYACALLAGNNERVIFYHPNAPRPKKPYTSYQYFSSTAPRMIRQFDKVTGVYKIYSCNEVTYQVDCYSDDYVQALDEANQLITGWSKQTVRWRLIENLPITVLTFSPPQNTTTLIGGEYEARATFEIVFNIMLEDGSSIDDVDYFDKLGPIDYINYND